MSVVLAVGDHAQGALLRGAREACVLARDLAGRDGSTLEAVVLAPVTDDVREDLRTLGVATIHVLEHELLGEHATSDAWAEAITQLLGRRADVRALVAPASDRVSPVVASVAARTDHPLATNCTTVEPVEDGWELTRVRWGGVLYEDAHLDAEVALLTVAPHHTHTTPADTAGAGGLETFTPELTDDLAVTRVVDREPREGGIGLATAPVVISGGRGVGSAEGFAVLEELAALLGGAVGCSRVATNAGWRSHNDQVGQTGTRVAPDLYIACGISGATQHWVGCMNAKRILAINTDADAPMVTRAHEAVIGDLHDLLPALIEEIRSRQDR